eukprot:TRINITY_DN26105_c0_g1_i1.p1 TRINITY_DN26105_c0_g1~~TRINITY_DN26105_c0_g1_i1.p1  ORF type:complete len:178 (+),score=22.42 TRINITY_DN26105_c0_g1_i1:80-613(+)
MRSLLLRGLFSYLPSYRPFSSGLSHIDSQGRATMVDISGKSESKRTAVAGAKVILGPEAFALLKDNALSKGDALSVSQIAGILGAKRTSELIPLCHPLRLSQVNVELSLDEKILGVNIECVASVTGRTGVEMEALMGASIAALTLYDMTKAVTHDILITEVRLLEKTGGKRDVRRDK